MQIGAGTWKWSKEQKLNLTYGQALPLLGVFPKDLTFYSINTYSAIFNASKFIIVRK